MSAAEAYFLPWVRFGAAGAVGDADPLAGALPAGGLVRPWVEIAQGGTVEQEARLLGPGHVAGLGQVVTRTVPAPDTPDAEPNYFPFAEVAPPDLPWRFTPAAPGADGQLRPWLVLVAVRRQDGVTLGPEPGAPLPVLRIEAPARPSLELPDLADSAAWVHVQSRVPAGELAGALAADPTAAVARLLCPRHLGPDASWLACLVPAFDLGVAAGLGEPAVADSVRPAWRTNPDLDLAPVRLPVYHSWTFATGPAGDFESLARRLRADDGGTVLGRVRMAVGRPGAPLPDAPDPDARADLVGALHSPGVRRRGAPEETAAWYERRLTRLLDDAARRTAVPAAAPADYDPERDDPVVAPPFHGAAQASASEVLEDGWLRAVNLDPQLRAVAGLGAAIVRANQESLVASAWAQAGSLRETLRALDGARLAVEAGRSLARRVAGLDQGAVTQLTRPLHAWVPSPAPLSAATLAHDLWHGLPAGLVGGPAQRVLRPSRALGRTWTRTVASARRTDASATATFLAATRAGAPPEQAAVLDYAAVRAPVGAWTADALLDRPAGDYLPMTLAPRLAPATRDELGREVATQRRRLRTRRSARTARTARPMDVGTVDEVPVDLSGAAGAVVAGIDPMGPVRARLFGRVPALARRVPEGLAVPELHPVFPDPLSADLVRLDPRFLLPGAERLDDNRVALVVADDDFVATLLVGANAEMSRELRWREYPTDPAATFFPRFWDTGPDGAADIGDIASWHGPLPGRNVTGVGAGDLAVVIVRGDVVRRYPDLRVYAVRATWAGATAEPDETDRREPVLLGALDRATRFYGIPVPAADLRGDRGARPRTPGSAGWYLVLEEPANGPRFGLDEPAGPVERMPATWDDLTWGHLAAPGRDAADVRFAVARRALPERPGRTPQGPVWGRNAAHLAAITHQRPYRVLIHADQLLPDPDPDADRREAAEPPPAGPGVSGPGSRPR